MPWGSSCVALVIFVWPCMSIVSRPRAKSVPQRAPWTCNMRRSSHVVRPWVRKLCGLGDQLVVGEQF